MPYLKAKQVKGIKYYQVVEAYREAGQRKDRVLLHLGRDLASPDSLLRWWNYLGQPRIPYRSAETITDLDKFLRRATAEERTLAAEGLKFLGTAPEVVLGQPAVR